MDKDVERVKQEQKAAYIAQYLDHPVTKELLHANERQAAALTQRIMDVDVVDAQTFFEHFVMIGIVKGLKETKLRLQGALEDTANKIAHIE